MNGYYEILGLQPGASQLEIKKAYFKLVRQYSPESNPEQFQKIREAYEQLKNIQNAPEGPTFSVLEEPFAEKMLKQVEKLFREGNFELCRDTCQEACRLFPESLQFIYYLVLTQRKCGNTGKAVKNAELLVKKEPGNKWFQKELAVSYMERGFTQKAYLACERAFELGCQDVDFILMYATECGSYGRYDKGAELLLTIIRQEKRWSREDMPELVQAYLGLVKMNYFGTVNYFPEILERLHSLLEQYGTFMAEYLLELSTMLSRVGSNLAEKREEWLKAEQIFDLMEKLCRTDSEKGHLKDARKEFNCQRFINDKRIGKILKRGYEAWNDLADMDPMIQKFAMTDTQLCMIEERLEILEQAEIIRQDYPEFYEAMQNFFEKLKVEKNLVFLKESLQKIYRRMEPGFNGGYYYKEYPEEKKKAEGIRINDGHRDEPYVRETKKIGRNDPCPCGSGKKYKHCCLNKIK